MGNEPGGNIQQSGGIISSSSESLESPIPLRSNSRLRSNGGNSGGIPNEINISDSDKHNGDANSIRRISASAPASPTAGRADMDIHRNGGVTVAHHTPSTSGSPNPNLLNPERGLGPLAATTGGHHPQYQPLVPVPVPMTNSASSPPGDPNQAVPSRDVDVSSGTGSTERFLRELSANSSQVEEHNFRISGSPSDHPNLDSQQYQQMQNHKEADVENSLVNTTVTATVMQIEDASSSDDSFQDDSTPQEQYRIQLLTQRSIPIPIAANDRNANHHHHPNASRRGTRSSLSPSSSNRRVVAVRHDNYRPKEQSLQKKQQQPSTTSIRLGNHGDHRQQRSPTSSPSRPQRTSPTRRPNKNTNNEILRHLFRHEAILQNDPAISPALSRRLRDFSFAQQKRRETYGYRNPWGIIGLYDHLTGIRVDIEWAEDAAWRRENNEPYLSWKDFETAKDTGFNQPFFTYCIMFICTACLVLSIGVNGWKIESLKDNPMIGPSAQTLIDVGAQKTSLIVTDREWFRLLSPMFLHAGVIHYVLNMLAFWFVGYAVEMNHGAVNAAILFIVPAIGGTIMSALFLPGYISVGASGGIFGLIGGCVADIMSNWNLLFSKVVNPTNDGKRFRHFWVLVWLFLDILLNVVIGLTPFVDNFTHLGGMIYGFLCGLSKLERLSFSFFGVKKGILSKIRTSFVRFFGFIISIFCIIVTLLILMQSDGEKMTNCRGCRYVSCVPFPFWAEYQDKWWYCDDCDSVKADAKIDTVTNFYTNMTLTCPDGSITGIDLADYNIKDQYFLQRQLPGYCRENCVNLFAGRR